MINDILIDAAERVTFAASGFEAVTAIEIARNDVLDCLRYGDCTSVDRENALVELADLELHVFCKWGAEC